MTDLMPMNGAAPPALYDQAAEAPAPGMQRQHSKPIEASKVRSLWEAGDRHLLRDRANYQLNLSFALGEQWVMLVNRTLQEIEWNNAQERDTRTTVDKYGPRTRNLLARLVPEELTHESIADGVSAEAMRAKQVREQILEGMRTQSEWEDTRVDQLLDTVYGGTAAIAVDWDDDYDPEDEWVADALGSGLEYQVGCSKRTPLSILDFTVEPGNRKWSDARWWIWATTAPPEAVQERYGMRQEPPADARSTLGARHRTLLRDLYSGDDEMLKATAVYTYYERPTKTEPGQVATVVAGEVVERKLVWPFPFKCLNLYVFRADRVRGRWTGATLLNTARPVQMAVNHIRSTILAAARRCANLRLLVPEGSIPDEDALTTEMGEILWYNPDPSGARPDWARPPEIARWLSQEADRLVQDLDDIFHTADITRGELADRTSGLAASIAAERSDNPLTFIARDQARGHARLAELELMMLAAKKEGGTITLQGPAGPIPVRWSTADIGRNPRVVVPVKATMPRTKVATQALMRDLLQSIPSLAEKIDVPTLASYLGVTSADQFIAAADAEATLIQWENQLLAQGDAPVPNPFNDHAKHIAGHKAEQNTPEYQYRSPDFQQLMELHIAGHEQMMMQDPLVQQMAAGGMPPGLPGGMAPPPGLPPGPDGLAGAPAPPGA